MLYQIIVEKRDYSVCSFQKIDAEKVEAPFDIDPFEEKLFHHDVFTVNINKKTIQIENSQTREKKDIAAILLLSTNKTYGRNAKGKLLYKCIPNNTNLPSFLVPYEVKKIGFSKVSVNIYITIQFQEWKSKHPTGIINQIIGPVDVLPNFYEYQLYCKDLNYSLKKMNQHVLPLTKDGSIIREIVAKFPQLEDRTHSHRVFSIDPEGSMDFDDAFSIRELGEDKIQISIYIANVTLWLEFLNLWEMMEDHRVSTVYLPDNKRPMLPSILSDNLCSLKAKEDRFALVLDITYCLLSRNVIETKLGNAVVCLDKNYVYEENSLLKNVDYLLLEKIVRQMSGHPQMKYMDTLNDSHDIVAYLMIYMNHCCAYMLVQKKQGIFRSIVSKSSEKMDNEQLKMLPENVAKFIQMTTSFSGKYLDLSKETNEENISHCILKLDSYIHITSPIRRLVDVLNMIQIQQQYDILELSPGALDFYQKWTFKIDVINQQMKQIRIVQNECQLLDFFEKNRELLKVSHKGYTYHQKRRDGDPLLTYQYTVYLPELNLMTQLLSDEDIPEYSCNQFKLFVFHNEDKMKKKIRIQKI